MRMHSKTKGANSIQIVLDGMIHKTCPDSHTMRMPQNCINKNATRTQLQQLGITLTTQSQTHSTQETPDKSMSSAVQRDSNTMFAGSTKQCKDPTTHKNKHCLTLTSVSFRPSRASESSEIAHETTILARHLIQLLHHHGLSWKWLALKSKESTPLRTIVAGRHAAEQKRPSTRMSQFAPPLKTIMKPALRTICHKALWSILTPQASDLPS